MGMFAGALPQAAYGIDPGMVVPKPQAAPAPPLTQAALQPLSQPLPPPQPKPSLFGQGGAGRAAIGNLGDFFVQQAGGQPIYGPAVQHQRTLQEAQQKALASLGGQYQLWQAQQDWKRNNPDPIQPTAIQKTYDWLQANHPELASQYLQAQTTAPPLVQHNADGTSTVYPMGAIPRVGSPAPASPAVGAIDGGYRFMGGDPSDQKNWQPAGGGDPASVGGAGSQAPRPFR